jgi:apurinic endonuclease APN1
MRKIGLHIRLETTIFDVAEKAHRLHLPFFQCFFIKQKTDKFIDLTDEEFALFKKEWASKFEYLYVHGTFWVNLAASRAPRSFAIMKHELHLAQKLGFTHYILHPGSAIGSKTKKGGIDHLAKALNKLVNETGDVIITLENTAHAGMSLGGDPEDFKLLMEKIDKPEKIAFCIDTAHAYAYGYNIADDQEQDKYIALLDEMIGLKKIVVLHINDTKDALKSKVDRHAPPGEGKIGADALKRFINHKAFAKIPIILELPPTPEEQEKEILHTIKKW